tara:strand:+ start:1361 stop:1537 length:177 start_codon:yes stop_codon:yes gene_type:complete
MHLNIVDNGIDLYFPSFLLTPRVQQNISNVSGTCTRKLEDKKNNEEENGATIVKQEQE